jgi:thiol-disulfide isomerase/thioredoxin
MFAVVLAAGLVSSVVSAQAVPPAAAGSEVPLPVMPAPAAGPVVSAEAQAQLDQMASAYTKLEGFAAVGTFAASIDIAGQVQNETTSFTSTYASPLKFRHEVKDQILLGGTGEKMYAFQPGEKMYVQVDSPREKIAASRLPTPMPQILRTQNPLLLLALSTSPVDELTRGATSIKKVADTEVDGKAYPTVLIEASDGTSVQIATNSETHLIRRMTIDMRKAFESRGAPDVKTAQLVVDYTETSIGTPAGADFAWAPPEGATDAAAAANTQDAGAPPAAEASALEKQPAPDFSLPGEAGADVKLSDHKGSVVVLDFWATWCPPCREGLPALDKLASDRKDKPLKVFAVNLREGKDLVADFKTKTSLGLPVLFDSEGKVGDLYRVTGIPQTVVIDKQGIVRRVIIGFDPAGKKAMEELVDALLAE